MKAFFHLPRDGFPCGGGELLFDRLSSDIHVRRARGDVVAVGTEEMQQTLIDQPHPEAAGREGRECLGVHLEIERVFKELFVDRARLESAVALDMGKDDLQTRAVLKRGQFFKNLFRP